jgi:hypothetical protein
MSRLKEVLFNSLFLQLPSGVNIKFSRFGKFAKHSGRILQKK